MAVTVRQFKISSGGVQQIQGTDAGAFAAILADGSVVDLGLCSTMAETVRQFKISSGGVQQIQATVAVHLLRFWQMDPSLPGVMKHMAVTARQFEVSSRVCSRFRPQTQGVCCHSGRCFCRQLGWCKHLAVTARQFEVSSRVCSRFRPLLWGRLCCHSGRWICRYLGCSKRCGGDSSAVRDQLRGVAADSGHKRGICCHSGRWICRYLGFYIFWRWQSGRWRSAQVCLVWLSMPDGSSWLEPLQETCFFAKKRSDSRPPGIHGTGIYL